MKLLYLLLALSSGATPALAWFEDCESKDEWWESRGWIWISPFGAQAGIYMGNLSDEKTLRLTTWPWDVQANYVLLSSFYYRCEYAAHGAAINQALELGDCTTDSFLSGKWTQRISGGNPDFAGAPVIRLRTYEAPDGMAGSSVHWIGPDLWWDLRRDPKAVVFSVLADEGRRGGRRFLTEVKTPWVFYKNYDACSSTFFSWAIGYAWENSGYKGRIYVCTRWRIRVDVVEGSSVAGQDQRTDGTSASDTVLSRVDVVSRLDSDPLGLGATHYWGDVKAVTGRPVKPVLVGSVINLPRKSGEFGFAPGSARIPFVMAAPALPGQMSAVVPVAVTKVK